MIEKCAEVIVNWLIKCEAIKGEEKELYSYAVYSFILSLSPLTLAICFGICMGCVRQAVLIVLPFMFIRKFSGGYHTKHLWSCLICSCVLLLLCMVLSVRIQCDWRFLVVTVLAIIGLICFSPIENENRKLDTEEQKVYKKVTILLVMLFGAVDLLFIWCKLYEYSVCISIGMILSAGLQIPCLLEQWIHRYGKVAE